MNIHKVLTVENQSRRYSLICDLKIQMCYIPACISLPAMIFLLWMEFSTSLSAIAEDVQPPCLFRDNKSPVLFNRICEYSKLYIQKHSPN